MIKTVLLTWIALTTGVAYAIPPEGLENFGVLNQGKVSDSSAIKLSLDRPVFRPDFESLQYVGGTTLGENYLSYGARGTLAPKAGDRSAFFLKYDWVFDKKHSFAIKYIHEVWQYISSAKESFGVDYNGYFPLGKGQTGVYVSFGGYYRYLKQRWDEGWYNPFNLSSEDQEGFFQGVLGWQIGLPEARDFVTIDVNWRDEFSYYNFDNAGFDLGFNFEGKGLVGKIIFGIRTAAITMGTGNITEYNLAIGFETY